MSRENSAGAGDRNPEDVNQLMLIGLAAALVLVLFVATISTAMIFALRADVAALENRARKSAKAAHALREELAALKAELEAAQPMPVANGDSAEAPAVEVPTVPAAPVTAALRSTEVQLVKARGAIPICVFRSRDDADGLENCIKLGIRS